MLDGTSQTVPLLKQLPKFFLLATIAVVCSSAGLKKRKRKEFFKSISKNTISNFFFLRNNKTLFQKILDFLL